MHPVIEFLTVIVPPYIPAGAVGGIKIEIGDGGNAVNGTSVNPAAMAGALKTIVN